MCQCTHSLYIKDRDRLLTGFWTLRYRVLVSLYLILDTSKLMSDVASQQGKKSEETQQPHSGITSKTKYFCLLYLKTALQHIQGYSLVSALCMA